MFCRVPRIASVTSCSALGSAVSTGMPSSSSGTAGAASSPPFSEIAATPVSPWNSSPTRVSLRIGASFPTMASATTRRGLSSFTETTSPIRMPLKLTLPPLRRPDAGPSKMMRIGLRALVVWSDWNQSTKPNAAAITASVNDPIRTKFARVSINPTPVLAHHGAGALAVEILPQPGMLRGLHVGHRSCCNDLTVPQNCNTVTSGIKAVQIVGYHENRQAQSTLQGAHQLVEVAGADRIEARGRLIGEYQFGIERQRAGQRHALDHAAGQLGGKTVGDFGAQSHHAQFGHGDFVEQALRDVEIFAHRELDVLAHRQRGKQGALLEQDAPAPFDAAPCGGAGGIEIDPEHFDPPAGLGDEADDGARQHRLARAGRTDKTQNLAALDVEVEPIEHLGGAELHRDIANPDDGVDDLRRHHHIPIDAKKIAKMPSMTMTKKMPCTTDEVVCCPSDSALPSTASPSTQATIPITAAITGALIRPTVK